MFPPEAIFSAASGAKIEAPQPLPEVHLCRVFDIEQRILLINVEIRCCSGR